MVFTAPVCHNLSLIPLTNRSKYLEFGIDFAKILKLLRNLMRSVHDTIWSQGSVTFFIRPFFIRNKSYTVLTIYNDHKYPNLT